MAARILSTVASCAGEVSWSKLQAGRWSFHGAPGTYSFKGRARLVQLSTQSSPHCDEEPRSPTTLNHRSRKRWKQWRRSGDVGGGREPPPPAIDGRVSDHGNESSPPCACRFLRPPQNTCRRCLWTADRSQSFERNTAHWPANRPSSQGSQIMVLVGQRWSQLGSLASHSKMVDKSARNALNERERDTRAPEKTVPYTKLQPQEDSRSHRRIMKVHAAERSPPTRGRPPKLQPA